MKKEQITIVQQGNGVPALLDNDARIALDPNNSFKVLLKPHGHGKRNKWSLLRAIAPCLTQFGISGDVHDLLYKHEVAKRWVKAGIKWITFFQDTNGLGFHTLPLALGVSVDKNLIMNSLGIPRKAKQAVGAITKLTNNKTDETR
jgi:UDP-sugar pyrophosphorylase